MISDKKLRIMYSDGGCNNGAQNVNLPGWVGAWAFVEQCDGPIATAIVHHVPDTTNNRTEMMAVISAVRSIDPTTDRVRVFSDSGYVVTGWNDPRYLEKWMCNGWRTSKKDPVENQDLWKELLELRRTFDFELALIKGHGKNRHEVHNMWNGIVDNACTWMMHNVDTNIGSKCELVYDITSQRPTIVQCVVVPDAPLDSIIMTINVK